MNHQDDTERGAAEWFLAIHAGEEPDSETLQAWLRWLEASEENRLAFEEILQVWNSTPAAVLAKPAAPVADEDYDGSIAIAEWRARKQTHAPAAALAGASSVRRVSRLPRFLAIAASLALIAIGLVSYREFVPIVQGEFATRTGEQRQLKLADGSRVTLGAHSKLTVNLTEARREVRLQAGEAYFSVHKDRQRPFVVSALNSTITAVGTAFNVRAVEDRVTVTVSEGSVKVADLQTPTVDAPLSHGEQMTYTQRVTPGKAATVRLVDANESTRWREGWLVYRDEPLKYVVADIARYTDVKVEVTAAAAEAHFNGAVFKDDIDEWLRALPDVIAVSVTPTADGFKISSVQ